MSGEYGSKKIGKVEVSPCGDVLRSLPSGSLESPTDLEDGNLGLACTTRITIKLFFGY